MGPINRAGPRVLGAVPVPGVLPPGAVEGVVGRGAIVVDLRDRAEFAAGHIPGALNIELADAFATYVGWTVPFDAPIVLVAPEPAGRSAEAAAEAALALVRIGYERVLGRVAGGMPGWIASGRPVRSYPIATMRELYEARVGEGRDLPVLDVRQPAEWRDDGAIRGSELVFVADLPGELERLRGRVTGPDSWWMVCTTGHRASIAASILDAAGIPVTLVARGGVIGWVERFEAAASSGPTPERSMPVG
jgi:rhodanese-related sulfurtransferase